MVKFRLLDKILIPKKKKNFDDRFGRIQKPSLFYFSVNNNKQNIF